MAPPLKLKQSSLHSFLLRRTTTTTHAAAAASTPPVTIDTRRSSTATRYEEEREDNIRRNEAFLRNLGIISTVSHANPKSKKPKKPSKRPSSPPPPPPPPLPPLRRSTRKRPHVSISEPNETPYSLPTPVDSSVVQYDCGGSSKDPAFGSDSTALGFRAVGRTIRDPSLAKIYTMDVWHERERGVLVAAAGHGGIVSVFGGKMEEREDGSLFSWKASKSWVSGVTFVGGSGSGSFVLSSSNDGGLVLWDTTKSVQSSPPPVVAELRGFHSGGIFSMDRLGCSIATASKDSSVAISRIAGSGELVVERSISGHHKGAIRGVRFRVASSKLADCGADGCISVLDTRLPEPCTLTIQSSHSVGVNNVEWSPTNEFLLLSASKDPTLLLYDIRNTSEPLHKLQNPNDTWPSYSCKQIYKPTFVDGGLAVATPDNGANKISVYSVITGKLLSQGVLGYRANLVYFDSEDSDNPRLWTAGSQINQLCPVKVSAP